MGVCEKNLHIPKLFDLLEADNIDDKIALLYLAMFYLCLEPSNAEKVCITLQPVSKNNTTEIGPSTKNRPNVSLSLNMKNRPCL